MGSHCGYSRLPAPVHHGMGEGRTISNKIVHECEKPVRIVVWFVSDFAGHWTEETDVICWAAVTHFSC